MKKSSLFLPVLLSLCLLTFLTGRAVYAQVGADRVAMTGLVADPSGASVPNAAITLINQDTGVKTVVATDGAGNF
ncbi:MAG: carboxypeptidase-like regulatory domain-containing protein, partial [Candidatus Dormibacteraceae bacterium]